jgi:beta-lactamase class D
MYKNYIVLFIITFFSFFSVSAQTISQLDAESVFKEYQANGTFVLFDLQKNNYAVYNLMRARTAYLPASTFKILNSLIGLEVKAVKDTAEIIKWDGVKRQFPDWNKDHSMKTAFKASCVPFYQEVARRIGEKRMQAFVTKANYGNKIIAGGIDQFWLTGGLRITTFQQIDVLRRLYENKLPFTVQNQEIVKDMMIYEKTENYTIRAKTGWAFEANLGWWVGYVETGNKIYFFAMNMDIVSMEEAAKRIPLTKAILKKAGILW